MAATHLVIIGDRDALSWVVTARRMAFPAGRSATLAEGDEVLLYTTRGCFRNPTRDLGRVMARARVAGPVRSLDEPVRFGERAFTEGCDLRIDGLAPYREGLVLRDLVPRLAVFPDPASWSVRLRRTILTLPAPDAELIGRELAAHLRPYANAVDGYHAARRGA
ncbi:hypothetical protein IQ279_09415 [Streptomyces verrucosisporus]|uniref:hypothetical protein n=1 Tax=Streptomyces verrucosisporus TaxID=1695161 RepID=UPI0019D28BA8|nr:hypothetical protein [Streptomyces verrucosisporus]MBN3929855.1 hypothetical protein [Streptomyces verrucosisporus]